MADVSPAPVASHRAASLVSLGIDVLMTVAAATLALTVGRSAGPLWALVAGLGTVAALVVWRGVLGGSVGHSIMHLRGIDALSGLPSFRFGGPRLTVPRGSDEDPFALRARPTVLAAPAPDLRPSDQGRSYLRLVVDDGTTHTVQHAALIGRDPTVPLDPRQALVAIPDLTRTIAKAHVLVEITPKGLTVTDLGSPTGTRIDQGPRLVPHTATPVRWGAAVLLGERSIVLEQRRRTADLR
ncbi:hypothetical protein RS85_01772 [Microbacterium sp. SA39]|nr:hypothetical protein RS85_01772 [Microbacterium sp. SA39]